MSIRKPFRFEPLADLTDRGKYYLVTVDLPHVNKENVHIYLDGDAIVVHAENSYVADDGSYNRVVYDREFTVPEDADTSTIKVSFKDGILRITMDKKREGKREIPIR
ncbi:MAG: Hsp20/alpha crystallin family protein [Thermoprotei archaeon]|jgi:HSP20 family protein